MPAYIEKNEQMDLPVIPLSSIYTFPTISISFELHEADLLTGVRTATEDGALIFITNTKKNPIGRDSDEWPFCPIGTVAKIRQLIHNKNGRVRVVTEGLMRGTLLQYRQKNGYTEGTVLAKRILLPGGGGTEGEALINLMIASLQRNIALLPVGSDALVTSAKRISDPGEMADFIASHVLVQGSDKRQVLECFDPMERARLVLELMEMEFTIMETEKKIRRQVTERMNRNQREYYLREEIKTIQEELGESGGGEVEEFAQRIQDAALPDEVLIKLTKENARLAKTPYGSAEATVIANYLDTCLDIPWSEATDDRLDCAAVRRVLDADHYGLEKVKDRIEEYIAAKQRSPELRHQILCLVGPPGVGKTSIGASIAAAMDRKYVRISLGGVRDEADIRGHRKTYIGAMPGRIITALTQAKVKNPLILLDEIDKLTRDNHGDPTSALLEVLDGEQNKTFRDHFVELPFDLSDCMFIATANTLESIPRPLYDRMEIIEMSAYTKREKLAIAKEHLVPKQMKRHGLNGRELRITDEALTEIIDYYTHEAGVRTLERTVAALCRKAGKELLKGEKKRITLKASNLSPYLGARRILPQTVEETDQVGCVNGLAYTELGGTLLQVEVAVLEGSGKIETTGSLGDVMKESAKIAVSYVRSVADQYGIDADFYKTKDLHIHFPEGATPKDGPSAGVTMVTGLISALSGIPVRRDVAMTGEVSLRGNVLPIGGLKEKTMAAYSAGVKTVLIPCENLKDLEELDPLARENLRFVPCKQMSQVLSEALVRPRTSAHRQGGEKSNAEKPQKNFVPMPAGRPRERARLTKQNDQ